MGLLKDLGIGKYLKKVKDYTDEQIENLIGTAPETLDTIHELAEAIKDNDTIIDALNGAITDKASKSELNTEIAKIEEIIVDNEKVTAGAIVTINKVLNDKANKSDLEDIIISGGGASIIEITYTELKSLRDQGELVPGQQYRIIDYVTTTAQRNTQSAGHQFDVIVTALDKSTLSENASAIRSNSDDGYFKTENLEAWELKYCLDNDTNRFEWAGSNAYKAEFVAMFWDDPINGINYDSRIGNDKIYDYSIEQDPETGEDNVVIYKSEVEIYNEEGSADYNDKYFYRGIVEVDGKEYDSWKKWEVHDEDDNWVTNEEGQCQYALTERIVFNGQVIWPESYKDNGKGVIYYMKDEYGNECPYDFKNIQFKHPNDIDTYPDYYYTFTWIDDNHDIMDTSVFGNNGTLTFYGEIYGVYGNVIKPYIKIVYNEATGDYVGTKQTLNNIVFISDTEYEGAGNEGFYGCYNNSFGNYCSDNSFVDNCSSNSFGIYCYSNSFGNGCYSNSFGNECYGNSFGSGCSRNSFGDNCYRNSFGDGCSGNSFGSGCSSNSFGNSCSDNSFGSDCSSNSFGIYCSRNSFGDNCYRNSFGDGCSGNSFGSGCSSNSFGNSCSSNSFGNSCSSNSFGESSSNLKSYYRYIIFDNGNSYINLNCTSTSSSSKYFQNVRIGLGVNNTTRYKTIDDSNVGQTYQTLYKPTDSKELTA